MNSVREELIHATGNSYKVQNDQRRRLQNVIDEVSESLAELSISQDESNDELDALLAQAEALASDMDISLDDIDELLSDEDFCEKADALTELTEEEKQAIPHRVFEQVQTIEIGDSWDSYMSNIEAYAKEFNINLSRDPFEDLLTVYDRQQISERIQKTCIEKNAKCDKIDYGFAALTGVLCALVDIFFVKSPLENKNLKKVDSVTESVVEKSSKMIWNLDQKKRAGIQNQFQNKLITKEERDRMLGKLGIPVDCCLNDGPDSIDKGITYLEKRFKVIYDSVRKNDLKSVSGNHLRNMNPTNHHIKSIAHSPDIIGWLFSIVDQFTGSASFIDENRIIHFEKRSLGDGTYELRGKTLAEKIIAGTVNWLGHLLSDMSGSTSTKDGNRGMGVCAPFMELMQLCPLSVKDSSSDKQKSIQISDLAVEIFTKGYDFRYSCLQAIPVAINECLIRLFWSLRQMFQYGKTIVDIVKMMNPINPDPNLQRMLLVGHGTLCVLESGEAAIVHAGNPVEIALEMNFVAWIRFAGLGYREIVNIYARKERNIARMDKDIQEEWERLVKG